MNDRVASGWHPACRIDDVEEGEGRPCQVAETRIGIFRVGGDFFALADECPHAGASLARGILAGDVLRCRIHHWAFCVRDGTYLDEDKPECNARSFPVRLIGDEVWVRITTQVDAAQAR